MSGWLESLTVLEIGWPWLNSSKCVPPTRRETKIACFPEPVSSLHTTHGDVAPPGTRLPAATRGSSASCVGTAFSEQAFSASWLARQALVASSVPVPVLPTATHLKPPSCCDVTGSASLTALAAKTCSLAARSRVPSPSSYHTAHGTVSLGPVNAMSGASLSRLGSMFSDGSWGPPWPESRRLTPVWIQQNLPRLPQCTSASLAARETKIWSLLSAPSISFQATHGTGSLPATVAPPATEGSSASRLVWMFSDGAWPPALRSWPSGIHTLAVA